MSTAPDLSFEEAAWAAGELLVCGLDEVGRGAWAGPVMLGAVVVPQGPLPEGSPLHRVRDSKDLTKRARTELAPLVEEWALASAVGSASAPEIDELGMTAALRLAARRALQGVREQLGEVDRVLLDGPHDYLGAPYQVTTIVKGDMKSVAIAAASILAKVQRDTLMTALSSEHPEYGFERNMGYGSPAHKEALEAHGALDLHRRSWSFMRKKSQQMTLDGL